MMRRLPVYFLIDVSESMVGEPIKQVEDGMRTIIQSLRTDPYALETVHVSIIAFAGRPVQLTPLEEIYTFYPPSFPIGGGTSLGHALNFLMDSMDRDLVKTTATEKGDWKPIVFLFSDGNPTDRFDDAFRRWNDKYRRRCNLIAICIGKNLSPAILGRITENVLLLKDTDASSFKKFFKWVTDSIRVGSERVAENTDEKFSVPPPPDVALDRIDHIDPREQISVKPDENLAVILSKCSNTKRSYLIKFVRQMGNMEDMENILGNGFQYTGSYAIDEESYHKLSDPNVKALEISSDRLHGTPNCPCCGNAYGLVVCGCCGKSLCASDSSNSVICPWCGAHLEFTEGDGGGFNINRTIG